MLFLSILLYLYTSRPRGEVPVISSTAHAQPLSYSIHENRVKADRQPGRGRNAPNPQYESPRRWSSILPFTHGTSSRVPSQETQRPIRKVREQAVNGKLIDEESKQSFKRRKTGR